MNKECTNLLAAVVFVIFSATALANSSAPSDTAESTMHPSANVCGYNHNVRTGSFVTRYNAGLQLTGLGSTMVCALPVKYDRYIERVVLEVYYKGVSPLSCSLSYTTGTSGGIGSNNSLVGMTLNTSEAVDVWQYDNFGEVPAYNGNNSQNMLFVLCQHRSMSSSQFVRYGAIRIDYAEQQ